MTKLATSNPVISKIVAPITVHADVTVNGATVPGRDITVLVDLATFRAGGDAAWFAVSGAVADAILAPLGPRDQVAIHGFQVVQEPLPLAA